MSAPKGDGNKMTARRLIIAGLALATLAGLGAYQFGYVRPFFGAGDKDAANGKATGRRKAKPPVTVAVGSVRIADVPVTIDAVGTVQALNTVTIRTQVDGRLLKLAFEEGQDVHKDDVLALIDPTIYQAQYDQAVAKKAQDEANLANARVDLTRYHKLQAEKFVSAQQYATQKALVAQLEAQIRADQGAIDNARALLDFTTIRSPIDGRTGIRLVDVGNILHASDQTGIVVVTQLKPIYVVFTAPQQFLPAIQSAQDKGPARAVALAPDNETPLGSGVLSVVDNQIDQATGTVRIKAIFDNDNLHLWPGQFVNIKLTVDTIKQAMVVPSAAIQRGPNGAFVYLLNDDETVTLRQVAVGRQDETLAVVTSGLGPNLKVLTSGFTRLTDGAKVRVVKQPNDSAQEESPSTVETPSAPANDSDQIRRPRGRRGEKRSERDGASQTR
jgi:multidrug efflux system membrane fusion protein